MFKTTATAWLVRLAITWLGAGVIAFLVADYVLRENLETVGASVGPVHAGVVRLEEAVAAQAAEIRALTAAMEQAGAPEPVPVPEVDPVAAPEAAAEPAEEPAPEAAEEPAGQEAPAEAPAPAEEAAPEGGSN